MTSVLIVDDEPLAVRRLELMLRDVAGDLTRVDVASGVASALERIENAPPDVLLLDVRMRDGTGFDVLRRMPKAATPAVVFVTAFDDAATRAFDEAATDYLLKPVDPGRLRVALDRAERSIGVKDLERRLNELQELARRSDAAAGDRRDSGYETEFWIRRAGGDFVRLDVELIEYALVEEDYVRLFAGERSYLLRESIKGLLARLDPGLFVQVHRSALVRVAQLSEVINARFDRAAVVLRNGRRLPLGRVHGKAVQKLLRAGR